MTPEEINKALEDKFKALSERLKSIEGIDTVEKNAYETAVKEIKESLRTQGEEMQKLISGESSGSSSFEAQLDSWMDANKESILSASKGGAVVEFVPKTVDITSGQGSHPDGAVPNQHTFNPRHFNLANYDYIYDLVSTSRTSKSSFVYTELIPEVGDFEEVLEGGLKPQISFKWETRSIVAIKIAAHEVLTEEVIDDFVRMKSLAKEYLRKKHNIKKARAILDYAIAQSSVFSAGGFALSISSPNFMDVINTASASIMLKENYADDSEAYANIVLVNPIDYIVNIVTAKDIQGRALFPNATFRNELNLGGLLIKPHKNIPAGNVFIADLAKMEVVDYKPYSVRFGVVDKQFLENKITMVGESRFYRYIENQNLKAFMMDDIDVIKTAITKP